MTIFLISFLFGISISQFVPTYIIFGLYPGIILSIFYLFLNSRKLDISKVSKGIVIMLIGLTFGIIIFKYHQNNVIYLPKESVGIETSKEAVILDIPVSGNYNYSTKAKIDEQYVLLRYKDTELNYGDKVIVEGEYELPESFSNDYGVAFDYPKFLEAKGINYIFEAKRLEKISSHHAPLIQEYLYDLRQSITSTINRLVHGPYSGLINGILIGEKSGLNKDLKDSMARVGVIHIAVLSGYNIMIVAMGLFYSLSKFSWRVASIVSLLSIIMIVLMSGAEPPAVRAGLLGLIVLLGKIIVHRQMHVGRALLLIASVIVFFNPYSLLYDISFQLSFLATLGLVYVSPIISNNLKFITEKFGLREIISATIGAQIAVTPLLLHTTGVFSIVSLPANILVLPAVPLLMLSGFLVSVFGNILSIMAYPFVWICHLLSAYVIYIVNLFDRIPVTVFYIEDTWSVILIYFVFGFIYWKLRRNDLQKLSN